MNEYVEMMDLENEDLGIDALVPADEVAEATSEKEGLSNGVVALVAVGATVVVTKWVAPAVVKGVKWGANKLKDFKERKKLRQPAEGEIVEPTEEQIVEAATEE